MADIENIQLDTETNVIDLSSKNENADSTLINNPLSLMQNTIQLSSQKEVERVVNTLNEPICETVVLLFKFSFIFSRKEI